MNVQLKNEDLEKENKILKMEIDELNLKIRKQKKKILSEEKYNNVYTNDNKKGKILTQTKSQSNLKKKEKKDHMEILLKEQISCMKKMLVIVQDQDSPTLPKQTSDYIDADSEENDDSNLHFEESFNVTNMSSNSLEYKPEPKNSEKDELKSSKKFEISLKAFEKNKKLNSKRNIENAIDDDVARIPSSHNNNR